MSLLDALKETAPKSIVPFEPKITIEDYHVPESLKRELDGVALTIEHIADFGEMGDRNILFSGPPGTGKTLGAQYLASAIGGLIYDGKLVNNADAIRMTFAQLREVAKQQEKPIFLVINEVDKFSSREQVIDPTQQATLNALLDEMQGFDKNENIYLIGTTNRADSLDNALRRPGRFSKEIEFMPPDRQGRLKILEIHAYRKGHKFKVDKEDLENLAEKTFGYTGADLSGLLNEAFVEALRNRRTEVSLKDLEYGFSKTKPSAIRDMPFREPKIKLNSLAGYDTHKTLLRKIISGNDRGTLLFYGPPGTGKTAFAEALAGEYGYNLLFVSGSELESKWVGESKDRLAKVFARAKQLRPCIVALDEIDSFLETKGAITHQKEQTGYMQSVMSRPEEGVYVIATTNNPHYLKEAMLDRFPYKLFFPLPVGKEQEAVWKQYAPEGITPEEMVQDGLSCRTIAHACEKAKTYGFASKEAVQRLVGSKVVDDAKYKELAATIGDDVADYKALEEEHA